MTLPAGAPRNSMRQSIGSVATLRPWRPRRTKTGETVLSLLVCRLLHAFSLEHGAHKGQMPASTFAALPCTCEMHARMYPNCCHRFCLDLRAKIAVGRLLKVRCRSILSHCSIFGLICCQHVSSLCVAHSIALVQQLPFAKTHPQLLLNS